MKKNGYPFTISLSVARLLLRPGLPLVLTASISDSEGMVPGSPEWVNVHVEGDDDGRPEVSLTGREWTYGVTPQIRSDGTITVFVQAGAQVNVFRLEAIISGKSEPAQCDLDVRDSVHPDPTTRVAALSYLSGKNQFAWNHNLHDLFHDPLVVRALDSQKKVVPDARVTFVTSSPAVSVCSAYQLTDQKGETSSAYLSAVGGSTRGTSVTASCNGYTVVFDNLFVVSDKLNATLTPQHIVSGQATSLIICVTGPEGEIWEGLSFQIWLEKKELSRFRFTGTHELYSTTVRCNSEGKAMLGIYCDTGLNDTYSENLIIQGGPVIQSLVLSVVPP